MTLSDLEQKIQTATFDTSLLDRTSTSNLRKLERIVRVKHAEKSKLVDHAIDKISQQIKLIKQKIAEESNKCFNYRKLGGFSIGWRDNR